MPRAWNPRIEIPTLRFSGRFCGSFQVIRDSSNLRLGLSPRHGRSPDNQRSRTSRAQCLRPTMPHPNFMDVWMDRDRQLKSAGQRRHRLKRAPQLSHFDSTGTLCPEGQSSSSCKAISPLALTSRIPKCQWSLTVLHTCMALSRNKQPWEPRSRWLLLFPFMSRYVLISRDRDCTLKRWSCWLPSQCQPEKCVSPCHLRTLDPFSPCKST